MTDTTPVLLTIDGKVATLTLNRPERRNAFDAALHAALRDALDRIDTDRAVRVVVITGAGDGFCAGQDLKERAAAFDRGEQPDLRASVDGNYNPLIRRLQAMPHPVIAAVNGVAAGAGASLALACDVVLASRSARFQLAFTRVALGPDSGASWLLQRRVGLGNALAMALTGDPIEAEDAKAMGIVWRLSNDGALANDAAALAKRLADGPPGAMAAVKRLMRAAATGTLDEALDAERDTQALLGAHPHYREAVTAFATKRTPSFEQD